MAASGSEYSPGLTPGLAPRRRGILHSIVRAYIETGEPVGSRTISRMRHLSLSPATIRNVMADLAEEGYLAQPHTSAGRIPTDKRFPGFRQYRNCAAASRRRPRPYFQPHNSAETSRNALTWLRGC